MERVWGVRTLLLGTLILAAVLAAAAFGYVQSVRSNEVGVNSSAVGDCLLSTHSQCLDFSLGEEK